MRAVIHEYLLDTCIWLALNDQDIERLSAHPTPFRLTAGCAALFELISGIPSLGSRTVSREFQRRSAALRRLLKAAPGGCLDLRTPHQIRSRAFGVPVRPAGVDFLILTQAAATAETPEEFYMLVSRARCLSEQLPTPAWLHMQKQRVAEGFRTAVAEGALLMRRVHEELLAASGIAGKDKKRLRRGFMPYLYSVGDLRRYALLAVASVVGMPWQDCPAGTKLYDWAIAEYERLQNTYDHSIDVYLDVYARYVTRASWQGGDVGLNDSFDLDQFVYMRPSDNSQVFVTKDRRLRDLASPVLPGRVVDLATFRKAIT